jgi:hypothetical protein
MIVYLNSNSWLVFVMEKECLYCEVETPFLNITEIKLRVQTAKDAKGIWSCIFGPINSAKTLVTLVGPVSES